MPKHILVAEDDDRIRFLIGKALRTAGFIPLMVPDGRQALDLFRIAQLDLVITDGSMPEIDGFQLAQHIRQSNLLTKSIPIILHSALSGAQVEHRCREVGINLFLPKSGSLKPLLMSVQRLLTV